MAGEQEIITKFKADTSELEAAITKEEQRIKKLETEGATIPLSVDDKKLNTSLGSAQKKFIALEGAAKSVADTGKKAGDNIASGMDNASRSTNIFVRAFQGISGFFRGVINTVRDFVAGARSGFREAIQGAGGFRGVLNQVGQRLTSIGAGIRRFITTPFGSGGLGKGAEQLRGGLEAAGGSTTRLTGLLRGLASPLGLLVGASAGFLLNMTRLDSVQVTLDGLKRGLGGILDQLAAGKISISGFMEAFSQGREAAEAIDKLNDSLRVSSLLSAQEQEQVEKLLIQSRDRTKSAAERVELLKEAQAIVEKGAEREIKDAQEAARIALQNFKTKTINQNKLLEDQREEIKNLKELTAADLERIQQFQGLNFLQTGFKPIEIDDEAADAAVAATNRVVEARKNAANTIEQAQNRINFITDQGADRAAEAARKEEARLSKIRDLLKELSKEELEIGDDIIRSNLSDIDKELFDAEKSFRKKVDDIKAIFAELRGLIPASDIKAIEDLNKRETELLKSVEIAARQQEQIITARNTNEILKEKKDADKKILDATLTAAERETKAITDKYADLLALNKKYNSDINGLTQEGLANEARLIEAQAGELRDLEKKRSDEALANLKKVLDERNEAILASTEQLSQALAEILFTTGQNRSNALQDQHNAEIASIEERFRKELSLNEDANSGRAGLTKQGIERQKQLEAERDQALLDAQKTFNEQRAAEEEQFRKKQRDAIIAALLDIVEAQVQASIASASAQAIATPDSVLTFGLSGLARAAILTALIKGVFAALKASLTGAFEGEAFIGRNERPVFPGERDAYIRRVDYGERIVTAKTNKKHFDMLEAMESGNLDQFIKQEYLLRDANVYLKGDTGQRMAQSIMLQKGYDRNIVASQDKTSKELHQTNELLAALLKKTGAQGSKRYW